MSTKPDEFLPLPVLLLVSLFSDALCFLLPVLINTACKAYEMETET